LKAKGFSTVKAIAVSSKTVTFSCPEGAEKLAVRKGKHKKTQEKKPIKVCSKLYIFCLPVYLFVWFVSGAKHDSTFTVFGRRFQWLTCDM